MTRLEKLLKRNPRALKTAEDSGDDFMAYYSGYYNSPKASQPTMERKFGLDYDRICEALEIDTAFIPRALNGVKAKLAGKGLDNAAVEKILNQAFSKHHIVFKQGRGGSDFDCQIISAAALTDGEIEVLYSKTFSHIFLDGYYSVDQYWDDLVDVLKRFISHELVHRGQFADVKKNTPARDFNKVVDKLLAKSGDAAVSYLSNTLELEAFAQEAVQEFRNGGYSDKQILKRVENPYSMSIAPDTAESTIFNTYFDYFTINDETMKKFLMYMKQFLTGRSK